MKLVKKQTIKIVADRSRNFFLYQRIIVGLAIITLGLLVLKVYYSNQLAISGARINYSERKAVELVAENNDLENQISLKSSLAYVETRAIEMGLVKISKIEVLKPVSPVALKQ